MTHDAQQTAHVSTNLPDEAATIALAVRLAPLLFPGLAPWGSGGRIHLRGDLGAGKTSFVRGLLRAIGVHGRIKSPSYALLESYNLSNLICYHFDFYRFSDSLEWLDAGFRDILEEKNAIVLIEWPEQAGSLLPPPDLDIHLEHEDEGRSAVLTAHSEKGSLWLTTLFPPTPKTPTRTSDGVG